ncbi:MAG: AAA family ATPase [Clostridia bacterium]|nr:AAA family ATPase [Clostridia bacterium]
MSQENDTTLKKLYNKYFQNKNEHSVNDAEKIAIFYAERKIKKIIERYESYKKFKFDSLDIDSFLLEINTKPSHITFKLNQTIHFLEYTTKEDSSWTTNSFDFDSYKNKTKFSFESIDDILINLPPPFLKYDIELEKKNKENINYKLLSSGELQLIQTLYTHAYHIQNLLSITDTSRVQYRNINLVFDELEICLHPEYQRKFLSNLIHLLEYFIKKEPKVQFNIFLITHSPFVLSDIPHTNILYMLTEEDLENNKVYPTHTFAQNIGEMLYDSFFMEKTIGEFAEEKLKELIRKKQGKKSLMSDDEAYAVLRAVGDPVIRSLIEEIDKVDGDIL